MHHGVRATTGWEPTVLTPVGALGEGLSVGDADVLAMVRRALDLVDHRVGEVGS